MDHGKDSVHAFTQARPVRIVTDRVLAHGPEGSSKVLLEGKANPLRLRQWTPLSDDELRMVDEGIAAHDELAAKLADVPAPGRTALPRLSP
jgi:hypothetical protein